MAAGFGRHAWLLALAVLALHSLSAHAQEWPPTPAPEAAAAATATPTAREAPASEPSDAPVAVPDGATTEAVAAPPAEATAALPGETAAAPPADVPENAVATAEPPAEALEGTIATGGSPAGAGAALVGGAAVAPDRVLYADDFANPNSGWPRQASDARTRRVGYAEGEYYVARLPGTGGSPYVMRAERYYDFLVELDARLIEPTTDAYLFLDFRWQPSGERYTFALAPDDGAFTLRRHTEQEGTTVIGWTPIEAINAGTAWNRLGVRAQGPEIVLLVNGKEVGRTRDDALREGSLGFGVGHFADRAAEARFTNLVVTSLD